MKPLLIVDGYNVIGAWKEAEKKEWSLDESRDRLLRLLEDYSGYSGEEIVLVFDGYLSDRRVRTEEPRGNVLLVYTRHAETADAYIERLVAQTPKYRLVRVATSDGLEQSQVLGTGAVRMTSRELLRELRQLRSQGLSTHEATVTGKRTALELRLDSRTRSILEAMRRSDVESKPAGPKRKPSPKPEQTAKPAPAQRHALEKTAQTGKPASEARQQTQAPVRHTGPQRPQSGSGQQAARPAKGYWPGRKKNHH